MEFFQEGPRLSNPFESDPALRAVLRRKLSAAQLTEVEKDLTRFGERLTTDILAMGLDSEAHPPRHVPFDPWGRRVDQVEVAPGWKGLDRVSAEEGIIATGYERRYGGLSRLVQFAKLYLFHPSSAFYTCPLAMADGAARALELYGDDELKKGPFKHLTSRDPAQFWTSGQWMTERTGGSDVSETSTIARLENGRYKLYGTKWFTSAVSSQMAMALARIEGAPEGSKGLSLFYIELRDKTGSLQNIRVLRLKDKLGTKAVPTAELQLEGTPARLVGGEGGGVRKIASLFNLTRVYNSVCAIGGTRRALQLAQDYATRRKAFGKLLSEQPLHVETLAAMEVEFQGAFHLTFYVAELLGKEEVGQASAEEAAMLRGLTPVLKLFTAKHAMALTSEALEAVGGAGYIEDTGLPKLLRDAQIFPIWEGTTNVLSLDLLRAIEKDGAFAPLLKDCRAKLAAVRIAEFADPVKRVSEALDRIEAFLPRIVQAGGDAVQASARALALAIGRTVSATLLLDHAEWAAQKGDPDARRASNVARRACSGELAAQLDPTLWLRSGRGAESAEIAFP